MQQQAARGSRRRSPPAVGLAAAHDAAGAHAASRDADEAMAASHQHWARLCFRGGAVATLPLFIGLQQYKSTGRLWAGGLIQAGVRAEGCLASSCSCSALGQHSACHKAGCAVHNSRGLSHLSATGSPPKTTHPPAPGLPLGRPGA